VKGLDRSLEMIFENVEGKKSRISVNDPREDLTSEDVQTAMDTIVAKNIFNTSGGDIVKAVSARIVVKDVVEILPQE
jgi:hypothetical protein